MSQEPGVVSAARRLRRLRWQMTLLFTAANLVGLMVLAGVALNVHRASARQNEYGEALRRLTAAEDLIRTDAGQINLRLLRRNAITVGHPELYVLTGDDLAVTVVSRDRRFSLDTTALQSAARTALTVADPITVDAVDLGGRHVFLVCQRFVDEFRLDHVSGVVVTVGDPDAGAAEHDRLLWALLAGTGTLVLVSSAVGYTLAGRAVRPALASLNQQERFLADASHELRTPVAALRAAAEAALAETAASATGETPAAVSRARLEGVVQDAHRLGLLVEALLTRARLKAGVQAAQRERIRLDLLVEDVIADLAEGGFLDADVAFESDPVVAEADPILLGSAVRNLIENAIRHGRHPGQRAKVRVSVTATTVTVADDGPGVSAGQLRAGFVRYNTSSQFGTGLGLSIVAEVAAAHGGRLEICNASGRGAVFTLVLS